MEDWEATNRFRPWAPGKPARDDRCSYLRADGLWSATPYCDEELRPSMCQMRKVDGKLMISFNSVQRKFLCGPFMKHCTIPIRITDPMV